MDDVFLTVSEIADTLKVNQQTVRNWVDRGELLAVRVGARRVRVRKSDFDAFLNEEKGRSTRAGTQYRVAVSDRDTNAPVPPDEPTPEVWFYEVEATSADRAVSAALSEWRKEVGRGAVAQSIAVNRN